MTVTPVTLKKMEDKNRHHRTEGNTVGATRGDKAAPLEPTWGQTWIARWAVTDGSSTHQRYYANETYARKFVKNRADAGMETALYVADTQWTAAGPPPPITSRKNRRKTEAQPAADQDGLWIVSWDWIVPGGDDRPESEVIVGEDSAREVFADRTHYDNRRCYRNVTIAESTDPADVPDPQHTIWSVIYCEEPDDHPYWYGGSKWGADEREEWQRENGAHYVKSFAYRGGAAGLRRLKKEMALAYAAGTVPLDER